MAASDIKDEIVTQVDFNDLKTLQFTYSTQHPRLVATAFDFQDLDKRIPQNEKFIRLHAALVKAVQQLVYSLPGQDVLPYLQLVQVGRNVNISREIGDRLLLMGLLYNLPSTPAGFKDSIQQRAVQQIMLVANHPYDKWAPERDHIDIAETTLALALGYDLFFNTLTSDQRSKIRESLQNGGLEPYIEYDKKAEAGVTWTKTRSITNQNCVYNGAAAVAALAIGEFLPGLAQEVLTRALPNMRIALDGFHGAGVFFQGPTYQKYANDLTVFAMSALRNTSSLLINPASVNGFLQSGIYLYHSAGPTLKAFTFSDTGYDDLDVLPMLWIAKNYSMPIYHAIQTPKLDSTLAMINNAPNSSSMYDALKKSPSVALTLLWYRPELADWSNPDYKRDLNRIFSEGNVGVFRSSWDANATFIAFKGGETLKEHSHLDAGSFIYESQGVRWFLDLGLDEYSLPGYFNNDGPRWTYYRTQTASHNAPLLDSNLLDHTQDAMKTNQVIGNVNANIQDANNLTGSQPSAIVNLKPAYPQSELQTLLRTFSMGKSGTEVTIRDRMTAAREINLEWGALTSAAISLSSDEKTATLSQNGKSVQVKILSPSTYQFKIESANPNHGSNPIGQKTNASVKRLRAFSSMNYFDVEVVVQIVY